MYRILSFVLLIIGVNAISAQDISETTRSFIHTDAPVVALVDALLIDGTGAAAVAGQTVLIEDGRIIAIGDKDQLVIPGSAEVINCSGKTIIPGFVMLHEHMFYTTPFQGKFSLSQLSWTFPRLYLAGGVTTMRTAGSINPTQDLNVRKLIESGEVPGPDMDVTGPFINSGDPILIDFPELRGDSAATRLVDFWADQGCTSFKVYMQITRDDLRQVVEAAHARGLKVTGHLCSVTYAEASEIGIDDFEHGFFMASDFDTDKTEDWCDPFNLSRSLRALGQDAPAMKELMQLLIERDVAVTSTLPVFEPMREGAITPGGGFDALDEHYQERLRSNYERRSEYPAAFDMTYFNKQRAWEKQFYDMGGLLVAGTDPTGGGVVIAGYSNQHIPELFVEGGFTVEEAINICTLHGAEYLTRADETGSVEVGKRADLILIDGDLKADISHIRNMQLVFKHGVAYDSGKLFDSVKGLVGTN